MLLPAHAPLEFSDRERLWNSVEASEKRSDSQLARRMIIALPKELCQEDNIKLTRQFCKEQFADTGMICDFAVHDKGDGNPHAHILLTMRALDEHGEWLPKSKSEYVLNGNGERVRQKNGRWKMRKVNTVDWNDRDKAELWRHEWEVLQNHYLERANRPERIDMRSFERQGITDLAPTVHMGAAATGLERKGIRTMLGDLNRDILAFNRIVQSIKDRLTWLTGQADKISTTLQALADQPPATLSELLYQYYEHRADKRKDWHLSSMRSLKISSEDWNKVQKEIQMLKKESLETPTQLKQRLEQLLQTTENLSHNYRIRTQLIKEADTVRDYFEHQAEYDSIYSKYANTKFKRLKQHYSDSHKAEINTYLLAQRFLQEHPQLKTSVKIAVQRGKWYEANRASEASITPIKEKVNELKQIVRWLNQILPESERIVITAPTKSNSKKLLPVATTKTQEQAKTSIRTSLSNKEKQEQEMRSQQEQTISPEKRRRQHSDHSL